MKTWGYVRITLLAVILCLAGEFFVTMPNICFAMPVKHGAEVGNAARHENDDIKRTDKSGAKSKKLDKTTAISPDMVKRHAMNMTLISRVTGSWRSIVDSTYDAKREKKTSERNENQRVEPLYMPYLQDQHVGNTGPTWSGIVHHISHISGKLALLLPFEKQRFRRLVRLGLEEDSIHGSPSFNGHESNNAETNVFPSTETQPSKSESFEDGEVGSNHVQASEFLEMADRVSSGSAMGSTQDKGSQQHTTSLSNREVNGRSKARTGVHVKQRSTELRANPEPFLSRSARNHSQSSSLALHEREDWGSPRKEKPSELVQELTGVSGRTKPRVHPSGDANLKNGGLGELSLEVYKIAKKERATSVAAAPCRSAMSWLPGVLRRLEAEVSSLQFYCIDTDGVETEMEHMKKAFNELSSLRFGGFITARPEDIEMAMPRNLDMVVSWFGIQGWGLRKALRFVKGLRRSGVRIALFTSTCTSTMACEESGTAAEFGTGHFQNNLLNAPIQHKSDESGRIVVYSLNGLSDTR